MTYPCVQNVTKYAIGQQRYQKDTCQHYKSTLFKFNTCQHYICTVFRFNTCQHNICTVFKINFLLFVMFIA